MDEGFDFRVFFLDGIEMGLADLDRRCLSAFQQQPDSIDGEFSKFHNTPLRSELEALSPRRGKV
jgi:hypothetical protein